MTTLVEHVNGTAPAVSSSSWTTSTTPTVPVEATAPGPNIAEPRSETRALSGGELVAVKATATATAILGVLGFVNSYTRVKHAAAASFGHLAWTLPIGVDLGILVFSALDIVLARLNMRISLLRLVPWALTGTTVYLNVADETSPFAMVGHAVLPLLWVLAVEIASHVVRKRAKLSNKTRMDKVRLTRWILAPASTASLYRRMVLWEIRSYPAALDRERSRVLAKTDLQDRYGAHAWRWKAPRRARALYRLGELTPYTALGGTPTDLGIANGTASIDIAPVDLDRSEQSTATGNARSSSTRSGKAKSTRASGSTSTGTAQRDFAALLDEAREVPRWRGVPSIERIRTTLHIRQSKAAELAAALTAEDAATAPADLTPTATTTAEEVA